jgi:Fe-S oxidoreductase
MFAAYADVPGYPLVFPVVYGAMAYFALAMARHLRVFAAAGPSRPFASVARRTAGLVVYALAQARMFRDARAGLMHLAIFWGFVALTVGTADIITGGLVQAIVGWPADGALWTALTALQNVAAVGVLMAVGYAGWRRLVTRPRRLALTRGALVILALIGGVVGAELAAMALGAARWGDRPGAIVSNALAAPLRTVDPGLLQVGFAVCWWAHVVLVAAFICYLPGSKHLHIATSFFNVYLRKLAPRGQLPAMDLEAEGGTFGVRTIADLGWKDLLDGFTCTECGRCTEACPANATGKSLDPRAMIMGIRHLAVDAEHGLNLIPNSPLVRETFGLDDRLAPAALATPIVDAAIPYDAVWDCVTCGACVEACPVLIEHVDKIVGLRRNLVLEETRFPPELNGAFRNMEQAGNPWGSPRAGRMDWTKDLPFAVPTVAEMAQAGTLDSLEVLYWVGCAAAFDERNRRVARAVATCLSAAGVRFAVLGQEESCTGDPARRMGNEYVYQVLAAGNIETLKRYGFEKRTIITACPHCFNTIGTEYGQLGGTFEILHHSVYLQGLLAAGRLPIADASGTSARSVTLHDSCYMARYSGISAEPREVLRRLPMVELHEMERRERSTFCCGAGGGRMWMEESRGTRINEERTRQALATGADAVVTECPFCMTMIRDGLSAAGDRGADVQAIDLAEILAASLAVPAQTR